MKPYVGYTEFILKTFTVIALLFAAFLGGQRWGEHLVRTELGDRRSDAQVTGWCVKSNLEGYQASGASFQQMQAALPEIAAYCDKSWGEFKVWVDAQIKEQDNESSNR
jgi:hypothetical protein